MTGTTVGLLGLLLLLGMLVLRVPVAFAMFAVGFGGITMLAGQTTAFNILASESYGLASSAELVVIPLFILMGNVATITGMSRRLYDAAYAVVGTIPGGLASATVLGCGGFAALSGSSVASALTMGKVSLSEMERHHYDQRLSTGAVAAGGTLGILIPPSTALVIYALLTEQSIGRLFLGGVLPGLLLLGLFVLVISLICWLRPEMGPRGPQSALGEKLRKVAGALPIVSIIVLTIGGIYAGFFSPVEAAAVGAGLMILLGVAMRQLSLRLLWQAARETVVTTATVMLILIAAHMINPFLALTHIPQAVGAFLTGLEASPLVILMLILLCYLVLGCFLEGFAMLVLTMPVFFPVIVALGYDPIWFGIIVVLALEIGLISPPVGVNVFVVRTVAPHVPLQSIFAGVLPFWGAMMLAVALLVAFPQIVLVLPNAMIR